MGRKVGRITTPILRITRSQNNRTFSSIRSQAGLTLIEIIVTVAIIGLIMGLSVGMFQDWFESALSEAAGKLAGTIRYVYNESAVKNQYYRMVIDLNEQTFSVESSTEPFKIAATDEGVGSSVAGDGGTASPPESAPADSETDKNSAPSPGFSAVTSYLLKPIKLPEGTRIKDVYVAHVDKKIEGGKTALYFFPNGWVEKAVINLSDEKGEVFYSIETLPVSGKVKIRNEYYEYKPEKEEE
jgi:prepilin-type N-terminal cleavage/methylation domain-containing protein